MSKKTIPYRTDNVQAKCSKSRKWEREARSAEMRACVCWLVCKMKLSIKLYNVAVL